MSPNKNAKFIAAAAALGAVIVLFSVLIVLHIVNNGKEDTSTTAADAGTTGEISTEGLVVDAYSNQIKNQYDDVEWHIPKLMLESEDAKRINDEIWNELYVNHAAKGLASLDEGGSVVIGDIKYDWAVNGDILSLWTTLYTNASGVVYLTYNVSVSSGKELTDEQLVAAKDLTLPAYYELAKKVIGSYFWEINGNNLTNEREIAFVNEQHAKSIEQSNVEKSRPYLDHNGRLCFHAVLYAIGGADTYDYLLNTEEVQLRDDYDKPASAATAPTATAPATTAPSTTKAVSAADLVTDAYSYHTVYQSENIDLSIPKLTLQSADAKRINDEIWEEYYDRWAAEDLEHIRTGISVTMPLIEYGCAVNGDILSLWVTGQTNAASVFYSVYNLSVSSGKELSLAAVVSTKGLTEETFYQTAKKTLGSYYWNENEMNSGVDELKQTFNSQLNKTLAQSNVEKSEPYLNEKGQLCFHGVVYSLGGAEYYEHLLNTETISMRDDYDRQA